MDGSILPYDIIRLDYKERPDDRFLATHLHRFEMFSRPVAIALVIEILNPWHPTSVVGQKIINDLVREFLASEAQSFLTRFEFSLKQVNRTIEDATAKTKIPVSCVAVLLEEEQVHCAGIGQAKLGLLRNGKLATILGGKNGSDGTFAAVTSGDLRDGDWLFIANGALYSLLTHLESDTWAVENVAEIAKRIESRQLGDQASHEAGILLRFNPGVSETNQTVLWEDSKTAQRTTLPKVSFSLPKINSNALAKWLSIFGTLAAVTWQQIARLIPPATSGQKGWRAMKRFVPLTVALVVIIVGSVVSYRLNHRQATNLAPETSLLDQVQAAPVSTILTSLTQNFSVGHYQALSSDDKSKLKILLNGQSIELIDLPNELTEAPDDISAIDTLGDELALVDSRGQSWIYNNTILTRLTQKQLVSDPIAVASFTTNKIVLSDSSGNLWLENDTATSPLALVQPAAVATGAKLVGQYQGNLYLIAKDSKATYRVSNFSADLNSAVIYNKSENLAIGPISDLAINGKVLAIDERGALAEFVRNKVATTKFQLPLLDGPIKIAASDQTPSVVISSGRLLYWLDANYTLVRTALLTTDAKIGDIVLSPNGKKLWLTIGKGLYSFNLP